MWEQLASLLLRYRRELIIICALYLIVMGYESFKVEFDFKPNYILPSSDPVQQQFEELQSSFAHSSTSLVIGIIDSSLYRIDNFLRFRKLGESLLQIEGVEQVLSLSNAPRLLKNTKKKKFELRPFFSPFPTTQAELDSLLLLFGKQRFYESQLIDSTSGATIMLLSLNKQVFESRKQHRLIEDIFSKGKTFSQYTGIRPYYGGLTYLRHMTTKVVSKEIHLFIVLSVLLTLGIFYLIFRSWRTLFPCVLLIVMMCASVFGLMGLLSYKISIVSALIPPIIVIVSMTNCVYFTNKYHQSYMIHKDKRQAIRQMVTHIGQISFITNLTTAIGFIVLLWVRVPALQEFGLVTGVCIMITFVMTMLLLPPLFSFLPAPKTRHTRHLASTQMQSLLRCMSWIVYKHKAIVLGVGVAFVFIFSYGATLLETNTYIKNTVSSDKESMENLAFFEEYFGGLMPLDVVVDTKKKKGIYKRETQLHLNELDQYLSTLDDSSEPLSLSRLLKGARQAYYSDDPRFYSFPNSRDYAMIMRYMPSSIQKENSIYRSLVDSTEQKTRVSLFVKDLGSKALYALSTRIEQQIDSIFSSQQDINVYLTGATQPFIRGNQFLVKNLFLTLLQAFVLIALSIALLFRRLSMTWAMLLVNLIPLLIVAGTMGFIGISLSYSTALIFSISYGIAVDNSIHFFAKYRMALRNHGNSMLAIRETITQIGSSMIYTALVLLAGFTIFAFSSFDGIYKLGYLTSLTLSLALLSNLLLFPSILLYIDQKRAPKKKANADSSTKES